MTEEEIMITEKKAQKELKKGYKEAKKLLKDEDKLEETLQRLEEKLKTIPVLGEQFAKLPVMVSMVRSYTKKDYTKVPIGTIVAMVSAVAYVVSPADLIPDVIPGVGYIDDAFVVAACLKLIQTDIDEYTEWREKKIKKAEEIKETEKTEKTEETEETKKTKRTKDIEEIEIEM